MSADEVAAVERAAGLETDRIDRFAGRAVRWLRRHGTGTPVLLLGGCGVPFPFWQPLFDHLRVADLIRMDRPGMSGTEWPGGLPRLADEVDTLAGLLDHVGAPAIIAAHSMAGPHAEALARERPDLVAGLVLVDSTVSWRPRPAGGDRTWRWLARRGRTAAGLGQAWKLTDFLQRRMTAWQAHNPDSVVVTGSVADPDAAAMIIAEQAACQQQLWDLGKLRARSPWPATPAAVLTAAGPGHRTWVSDQGRLARLLGAEHMVLSDAKHLIMLDRPDAVAAAVRRLSGPGGEGTRVPAPG